ncbi:MAG: hypothetical protein ACR2JF_06750 [Iamia sp.]
MPSIPTAELEAVQGAVRALTDQVGELIEARRRARDTLDDWTGGHRDQFDAQFPTSQGDLDDLRDLARAAGESARAEVASIAVDIYVGTGGD